MKAWISMAVVVGFAVIAGLGTMVYRSLDADRQVAQIYGPVAERGLQIVTSNGCVACHSLEGSAGIGPSFQGMFGKISTLTDGRQQRVDEAYVRESVLDPAAKVVQGYQNVMIRYALSDADFEALNEFLRQLAQTE